MSKAINLKDLKDVKRLYENGEYTYVGFVLHSMNEVIKNKNKEEVIISGENLSIFRNVKNNELVFISNYDIKDFSNDLPYGVFQKEMSKFNSNFKIEIKEGVVDFIFNEVINVSLDK